MIYCEVRTYACAATSEPVGPEVAMVFGDLTKHQRAFEMGIQATMPQAKMQGSRVFDLYGAKAIEFTLTVDKSRVVKRAFLAGGRCITLDFISNVDHPVEMEKFFGSFKGTGISNESNTNLIPVPANPAPVASASDQFRRQMVVNSPSLPTTPMNDEPCGDTSMHRQSSARRRMLQARS